MQMTSFFIQLRVKYLEYLAKLNRYISTYAECGFRLTDVVLNALAVNDPIGHLDDNANNPELIGRVTTLYLSFLDS